MKVVNYIMLFLLIFVTVSFAQTYDLKSYVVDDGGSKMTGGSYKLLLSISQTNIGKVSDGNYDCEIGFLHSWFNTGGIKEQGYAEPVLPNVFSLSQNFPNPVFLRTVIKYSVAKKSKVELRVYNATGREIATLLHKEQNSGHYKVNWDIKDVSKKRFPNGVYFYRLTAGSFTDTKKMVLVR